MKGISEMKDGKCYAIEGGQKEIKEIKATRFPLSPREGISLWSESTEMRRETLLGDSVVGVSRVVGCALIRSKNIVFLGVVSWDEKSTVSKPALGFAASSVELSIVMRRAWFRERLRRRRSSRLVQGVRTLVLLAHPVHDEHHHQNRAQQTDHCTADHR